MAVIDVCTFNGENEIWDIRYNILSPFVDEFIVCEATKTFSGKDKPLYFKEIQNKYKKVKYFVIDNWDDSDLWIEAIDSPNTHGADHWEMEFYIKESIINALTHLNSNDTIFVGDCDEIVDPLHYHEDFEGITKFKLRVYSYYLNNRSNELFWGTVRFKLHELERDYLNYIRNNNERKNTIEECGWHFTSMGGYEKVKQKLEDSYTEETYASKSIMTNLKWNIENSKDFLGRDFKYWIDESQWPKYLQENKEKYLHLMRNA